MTSLLASQGWLWVVIHQNWCLHPYLICLQWHQEFMSPLKSIWQGYAFVVIREKNPQFECLTHIYHYNIQSPLLLSQIELQLDRAFTFFNICATSKAWWFLDVGDPWLKTSQSTNPLLINYSFLTLFKALFFAVGLPSCVILVVLGTRFFMEVF